VKRNAERSPADFMFQLTEREAVRFEITNCDLKAGTWRPPNGAFRLHRARGGDASSVLRSPRAIHVNVEIMRAFVRLRQMLESHAELAKKLNALEKKYDTKFKVMFEAIRELMTPEPSSGRRIGFSRDEP
jgi:hypothetical protein